MSNAATEAGRRRVFLASGVVVSVLIFGFALIGVIVEVQQLWAKGATGFFTDAGLRLGLGALIAIVSAAPYAMLARAARQTGYPTFLAVACLVVLVIQLWFTIKALFFGRSSTAGIAIFFIPVYMCLAAAAAWGVALLNRRSRQAAP